MQFLLNVLKSSSTSTKRLLSSVIMEYLENGKVVHCTGKEVDAAKAFKNKKIIAYYFSASWCGPCKQLLPQIKHIYKENKDRKFGMEIMFVSSDVDKETAMQYFKERHGGWYAIPFDDLGAEKLRRVYDITHIPQIIVVRNDGTIVSRMGTKDIEKYGVDVLVYWNSDPI